MQEHIELKTKKKNAHISFFSLKILTESNFQEIIGLFLFATSNGIFSK